MPDERAMADQVVAFWDALVLNQPTDDFDVEEGLAASPRRFQDIGSVSPTTARERVWETLRPDLVKSARLGDPSAFTSRRRWMQAVLPTLADSGATGCSSSSPPPRCCSSRSVSAISPLVPVARAATDSPASQCRSRCRRRLPPSSRRPPPSRISKPCSPRPWPPIKSRPRAISTLSCGGSRWRPGSEPPPRRRANRAAAARRSHTCWRGN